MMSRIWMAMLSVLVLVTTATAATIHVRPGGDNAADGDAEHPVGSVQVAVNRVKMAGEPCEIIIHGGRYFERVDFQNPTLPPDATVPALIIRAADGDEVILDGSRVPMDARPLSGHPGVYTVRGDFRGRTPPQVWEAPSRCRYRALADLAAVAAVPGSVTVLDDQTAALHTTDGRAPSELGTLISHNLFGIFSTRDNLTIRGIRTENHLGWNWAAGVNIQRGSNVLVEDCVAVNAVRGFVAFAHSSGVRFSRCRVQDVGAGIYSGGTDVIVEHCMLDKTRDRYMVPIAHQDDSAIQFYSPAIGGEVRHNLVRGFRHGIFLKSSGGAYTVEHNTVLDAGDGTFNGTWMKGDATVIRYNVFSGVNVPLLYPPPQALPAGAVWDHNLCWSDSSDELAANVAEIRRGGQGANMIVADPRFVSASAGDYRVSLDSPAVQEGGKPWGAMPVAQSAAPDMTLPQVVGVYEPVAEPIVIEPLDDDIVPVAPRVLHVATDGVDGPDRGSLDQPFATLAAALLQVQPGDTIRLAPGFYIAGHLILRRSGTPERPITIEALQPDTVTLDGLRRVPAIFSLENVSNIVIRNLNIRWFTRTGISIRHSAAITVSGCRFQNEYWSPKFVDGPAVDVYHSPRCVFTHNIMARIGSGLFLNQSPGAVIAHNTATSLDYGGMWLLDSCRDTVVRHNAFCFAGNDSFLIQEGSIEAFRSLDMDYNNWATSAARAADPIPVPFSYMTPGKAVVLVTVRGYESPVPLQAESRLHTLADWQKYSGKDAHSIFADPRWIDPASGRWDLHPDSPNLGAGKGGVTIGATGAHSNKKSKATPHDKTTDDGGNGPADGRDRTFSGAGPCAVRRTAGRIECTRYGRTSPYAASGARSHGA